VSSKNIIHTPIGPREMPEDVQRLFESMPTVEKSTQTLIGKTIEWFEENGRLVSVIKPA
jgi:hypothetical protein